MACLINLAIQWITLTHLVCVLLASPPSKMDDHVVDSKKQDMMKLIHGFEGKHPNEKIGVDGERNGAGELRNGFKRDGLDELNGVGADIPVADMNVFKHGGLDEQKGTGAYRPVVEVRGINRSKPIFRDAFRRGNAKSRQKRGWWMSWTATQDATEETQDILDAIKNQFRSLDILKKLSFGATFKAVSFRSKSYFSHYAGYKQVFTETLYLIKVRLWKTEPGYIHVKVHQVEVAGQTLYIFQGYEKDKRLNDELTDVPFGNYMTIYHGTLREVHGADETSIKVVNQVKKDFLYQTRGSKLSDHKLSVFSYRDRLITGGRLFVVKIILTKGADMIWALLIIRHVRGDPGSSRLTGWTIDQDRVSRDSMFAEDVFSINKGANVASGAEVASRGTPWGILPGCVSAIVTSYYLLSSPCHN